MFLIHDGDEIDSTNKVGLAQDSIRVSYLGQQDSERELNMGLPATLKRIPISFWASIKLSFLRLCKCCSCFENRRDKLSHLADKLVKEELKIVRWP